MMNLANAKRLVICCLLVGAGVIVEAGRMATVLPENKTSTEFAQRYQLRKRTPDFFSRSKTTTTRRG